MLTKQVVYVERNVRIRIISAQLPVQKGNYMNNAEEELTLKVRSRPTTTVAMEIPTDT